MGGTRGSETSQYPLEEKINNDSVSSGERKRMRLNLWCVIAVRRCIMGVVGVTVAVLTGCCCDVVLDRGTSWDGRPERVRVPYLKFGTPHV